MDNSQSNVIFAYLLLAFVVFITVKGELPTYLGFLLGGSSGSNTGGGITAASIAGDVGNSTPNVNLNLPQTSNSNPASNFKTFLSAISLF